MNFVNFYTFSYIFIFLRSLEGVGSMSGQPQKARLAYGRRASGNSRGQSGDKRPQTFEELRELFRDGTPEQRAVADAFVAISEHNRNALPAVRAPREIRREKRDSRSRDSSLTHERRSRGRSFSPRHQRVRSPVPRRSSYSSFRTSGRERSILDYDQPLSRGARDQSPSYVQRSSRFRSPSTVRMDRRMVKREPSSDDDQHLHRKRTALRATEIAEPSHKYPRMHADTNTQLMDAFPAAQIAD